MSEEAIKFKNSRKDLNYKDMTIGELSKLPTHNGIINFKITNCSFLILNILNDDSSAVKFFWKNSHDLESLDQWFSICKDEGTYLDIGAHTGLYTLSALKANKQNHIICFEPYYLNMARLITNLRLNNLSQNVSNVLAAVSNYDGKSKFKIDTEGSYLSKGGRLNQDGFNIDIFKIDSFIRNVKKPIKGIKIDTEGEDLNVLKGSEDTIKKFKPKIIIEVREENKLQISDFLFSKKYNFFDISNIKKTINLSNIEIQNVINILAIPQ